MTPSELLVAAADRIRDLAAAAEPAPWGRFMSQVCKPPSMWTIAECKASENARWIAALSPAVAPALEQLLRDAAKDYDVRARIFTPEAMEEALASRRFGGALALARQLVPEVVQEGQT